MESLSKYKVESLSDEERQQLLLSCIPMLSSCESKAGNEGEAFFVSKDVIVKKYFAEIDSPIVLEGLYDAYCEECIDFRKRGYNIPMIYSWVMLSRPDHSGFDYYLLEERIPGRELFLSNITKIYDHLSDEFSKDEFNEIIANPKQNFSAFKKVISSYIHDFVEINERIDCMSDTDLVKFLEGVYHMFIECKYTAPDVHARNVLIYQKQLNLIDLYMQKDNIDISSLKATPAENLLLARIIALFEYNSNVNKLKMQPELVNYESYIDLNNELCAEAMRRVIRAAKKICKFSANKDWWKGLIIRLEKNFPKDTIEKVIKEIDVKIL